MSSERLWTPERDPRIKHIVLTTGTRYQYWYYGELQDPEHDLDKVRGDLALKMLKNARDLNFRIVAVDGGSSKEFRAALNSEIYRDETNGSLVIGQKTTGMSTGRVEGYEKAAKFSDAKVIAWVDPEKAPFIPELLKAAIPILDNQADIVIPARDEKAFDTYPPVQAEFEKRANGNFNELLMRRSLNYPGHVEFDMWFGPRLFRNDPELVALFSQEFNFVGVGKAEDIRFKEHIKPERWANALFLPVVTALDQGYRVASVPVEYSHPEEQTIYETGNVEMDAKRREQFTDILTSSALYLRELRGRGEGKKMRILPITPDKK